MKVICNGKIMHPVIFVLNYVVIPVLVILVFVLSCLSTTDRIFFKQVEAVAEKDSIPLIRENISNPEGTGKR